MKDSEPSRDINVVRTRLRVGAHSRLVFLCVLLVAPCAANQAPITLRTQGGDAWTFEKLIQGSVAPGACDVVEITSPRGTVVVQPEGERLVARVPLGPGVNTVHAECLKNGVRHGAPAQQNWFVRLKDHPKARIRTVVTDGRVTLDVGASEVAVRARACHGVFTAVKRSFDCFQKRPRRWRASAHRRRWGGWRPGLDHSITLQC